MTRSRPLPHEHKATTIETTLSILYSLYGALRISYHLAKYPGTGRYFSLVEVRRGAFTNVSIVRVLNMSKLEGSRKHRCQPRNWGDSVNLPQIEDAPACDQWRL